MRVPKFTAGGPVGGSYRVGRVVQGPSPGLEQAQQTAKALQTFGQGVGRLGAAMQAEVDEAEVQAAANLYDEYTRSVLDPQKGFRGKVGRDAKDSYDDAVRDLEDKRKEFGSRLQNDRQRELYERYSRSRSDRTRNYIDNHAARQVRALNIGEKQAGLAGKMEDYVGSMVLPDIAPEDRQRAREELKLAVGDLADLQGIGPEQRAQLLEATIQKANEEATSNLVTQERFDEAEQLIEGSDMSALAKGKLQAELKQQRQVAARRAELEADKQRAAELDGVVQTIVESSGYVDPQETIDRIMTDTPAPDPTPAQRGVIIRRDAAAYAAKEMRQGRMTLAQAREFEAKAESRVRALRNQYLEAGQAAFDTARRELQGNPTMSVQQMSNYEELVRLDQVGTVQKLVDEVRAPMAAYLKGVTKTQAEQQKRLRDDFSGYLLDKLLDPNVTQFVMTNELRGMARQLGVDLDYIEDNGVVDLRALPSEEAVMGLLQRLAGSSAEFRSAMRQANKIRNKPARDQEEARQRRVDEIIETVAIHSGVDVIGMRKQPTDMEELTAQMKIRQQLYDLKKDLRDPAVLGRFGLTPQSSVKDWTLAMPGMIDLLTIDISKEQNQGQVRIGDLSAGQDYRVFGTDEQLAEVLGLSPLYVEAMQGYLEAEQRRRGTENPRVLAGDIEDLALQVRAGTVQGFDDYLDEKGMDRILPESEARSAERPYNAFSVVQREAIRKAQREQEKRQAEEAKNANKDQ